MRGPARRELRIQPAHKALHCLTSATCSFVHDWPRFFPEEQLLGKLMTVTKQEHRSLRRLATTGALFRLGAMPRRHQLATTIVIIVATM
jgi:hypothetical protein